MLGKSTRRRILEGELLDQANPYQDFKRIEKKSEQAIKDLTLVAKKMDEKQLQEIFTEEKLDPLIRALLNPKNKRAIEITEMLANCVFQKLVITLPNDMVNELGGDIGKTWTFAKIAKDFWDKPLTGKTNS